MQSVTIRLTTPLAKAITKGSHRKEITKQAFLVDAIVQALGYIGDDEVDQLVQEHNSIGPMPQGRPRDAEER